MASEGEHGPAEWRARYAAEHATYVDLARRLETLIRDLLREHGIDPVQVESRAKSVESFVEKIGRKRGRYGEPLAEMTDLIGVRVIAYYVEDVEAIAAILKDEFEIDAENSVDKAQTLRPEEFGYSGVHYVVALGATRRALAEYAGFDGKRAEIQLRTAAQHAWSAIDHKLNYKSPREVPDELRRRFSRLSAIFELADDQFSQLRREHAALEQRYAASLRGGDLDLAIDSASLDAYMEGTERVAPIMAAAAELGWMVRSPGSDPDAAARERSDLARTLELLSVTTIGEFDAILADLDGLRAALERAFRVLNRPDVLVGGFPDDLLCLALLVRANSPAETIAAIYSPWLAELLAEAR